MKVLGKAYQDAKASGGGDFETLPAGGYVVRITQVTDMPAKQYLDVVYDIAEGQYKDFYADQWGQGHPFAHHFVMSYKDTALGMFKGRLRAIDESNHTNFEEAAAAGMNEAALVGRIVGVLIGYEEYVTNQGEIRQRSDVRQVVPAEKIRSGSFKVPELKTLQSQPAAAPDPSMTPPKGFTWDNGTPF